jgi:hypothetical protein
MKKREKKQIDINHVRDDIRRSPQFQGEQGGEVT